MEAGEKRPRQVSPKHCITLASQEVSETVLGKSSEFHTLRSQVHLVLRSVASDSFRIFEKKKGLIRASFGSFGLFFKAKFKDKVSFSCFTWSHSDIHTRSFIRFLLRSFILIFIVSKFHSVLHSV